MSYISSIIKLRILVGSTPIEVHGKRSVGRIREETHLKGGPPVGPSGRIATFHENDDAQVNYFIGDHLGSTRIVMNDPSGIFVAPTMVQFYNYYPYGGTMEAWGNYKTDMRFTGKEKDDEGSFDYYYFGARYYDSDLGRFTSIDKASQFASGFVYCANNPVSMVDQDGNWAVAALAWALKAYAAYSAAKQVGNIYNAFKYGGRDAGWSALGLALMSQAEGKLLGCIGGLKGHGIRFGYNSIKQGKLDVGGLAQTAGTTLAFAGAAKLDNWTASWGVSSQVSGGSEEAETLVEKGQDDQPAEPNQDIGTQYDGEILIYVFDLQTPTSDASYDASAYVQVGPVINGPYETSTHPSEAGYETLSAVPIQYNNTLGHKGGTRKGLNFVLDNTVTSRENRYHLKADPMPGGDGEQELCNWHRGGIKRRKTSGCFSVSHADAPGFFHNFDWSGTTAGGIKRTTGTSRGVVYTTRYATQKQLDFATRIATASAKAHNAAWRQRLSMPIHVF